MRRFDTVLFGLKKSTVHQRIDKLGHELILQRRRLELERLGHEAKRKQQQTEAEHLLWKLEQKKANVDRLILRKMDMMAELDARPALTLETSESPTPARKGGGKLGEKLLEESLITPEQLQDAMEHQEKSGGRLGDILVEMSVVDRSVVERLLRKLPPKGRLGDMLVANGLISQDQLDQALVFQRKSGGLLGDILMSLQLIEPEELYRAVATQSSIGRIGTDLDFENIVKLPEYMARQYDAVVVKEDGSRFLVAVGSPLTVEQIKAIEAVLNTAMEQVLATRDEMEFFWKSIYEDELMHESTNKLATEKPENSAHITFMKSQLVFGGIVGVALTIGLLWNWLYTLVFLNISIQSFYFIMTVFKFTIIMKGTRSNAQLRFTPEELEAIDERELPIYTILVPMYKESRVIPHLLDNIEQLDYPKAKLDVRLLIEEDDVEAQELLKSLKLPPYYTTIVVPHSLPKTKPKACNFGLIRARGEYVVIYDAEDRPDPDQLKKVHLSFQRLPEQFVCVQAKLNYFNSEQNLLTRWFTQEYSMWFELLLPGVMQLDIPIPLGGTSNHFKISALKHVNAWDPYNVTEDADLGIRLYKEGYKTAIVDSRTWEEATSRVGNWIRQRSRWIKGYMQTWLVHMRNPIRLYKELGLKGFLGFQVMVLATPLLPLLNPAFWIMVLLWYGWKLHAIPMFFPGIIYYLSAVELYIGNFFFVFSNLIGMYWIIVEMGNKGQHAFSYSLIRYALFTPIYWVLMSIAAVKAAWQLITKPFYWEKTTHGLTNMTAVPGAAQKNEELGT